MPSFAFESGYLVPASIGQPSTSPLSPDVRKALRDYLLDVIEADLFPIEWSGEDDPVLTAMDVAGQVVTAVVTDRLDGDRLLAALSRAGEATSTPWLTIAGRYPSGVAGFRRDWNAFRESRPPGAKPGPQLYVVAGEVSREVLEATRVLHGVQVFAVDARESVTGQQLLDVTAVQPATVRVLDGAVVHEIEPAITAASPRADEALSAPTPAADQALSAPTPVAALEETVSAAAPPPVARTAEEPPELQGAESRPVPDQSPGEASVPTPETATHPTVAPDLDAAAPAQQGSFPERARAAEPDPEPVSVDPQLRAVARLVGAPMPIELRHAGQVQHAVLTAEGALQVGEATVATIERATEILGGEPSHAWTSWHVAGFPMSEARAEATRAVAPVRASGRRRHRNR
ncbi:hypothetical protein [Ruania zhangjianzhongii]|uniref:hypothetical protein n=1 Tax=Ruania zhangjianzhongii TaxID=2603206 RepID=UPI0011CCC52B|nr:hypothetical protein [Ruania zhangjianzhongii]